MSDLTALRCNFYCLNAGDITADMQLLSAN